MKWQSQSDGVSGMRGMSLSTKLLVLVCLPVFVQFLLIGCLFHLNHEAEIEAERASRAKRITDIVNSLGYSLADVATLTDEDDLVSSIAGFRKIIKKVQSVDKQYAELKELTRRNKANYNVVVSSEQGCKEAIATFKGLLSDLMSGEGQKSPEHKAQWKLIRGSAKRMITPELLRLGKDYELVLDESPILQSRFRRDVQVLLAIFGGVNLLIAGVIGYVVMRNFRSRMSVLTENTWLLGAGKPLLPRVSGSDEIALLDRTFHSIANKMADASRKERAIVDNAIDMICTLDKTMRFLSANPASESYLNMSVDDILGRRLVEFLPPRQAESVIAAVASLASESQVVDMEVTLVRRDGSEVATSWSMRSSAEEHSIFCVVHNITERKRAEALRQELLAMITHDLFTPLASISNSMEMISMGRFGELDEAGMRYLEMAGKNAERMEALMDDLLDLEKARSGMMELNATVVNLQELFERMSKLLEPLAVAASMKLVVHKTELAVFADEKLLQRIITNLVGNAIKYAGEGASIDLSAELEQVSVAPATSRGGISAAPTGGAEGVTIVTVTGRDELSDHRSVNKSMVRIFVSDSGIGIPEDKRENLFERFYQARGKDAELGSGLGLSICKTLVELHGGTISVASQENKGTTFSFSLPQTESVSMPESA